MELAKKNNSLGIFDMFNDMFSDAFSKEMKTDIEETDKEYILNVEVPGVKKENITVSFDSDNLIIKVKQDEETKEEKNYVTKERYSMEMSRSYYLENVDENNISAKLENGILTLHINKILKKEEPKKLITIE